MADAPKKDSLTLFEQVILFLILLYFFLMLWWRADDFLSFYSGSGFVSIWDAFLAYFYSHILPIIRIFAFLITALCIWGIIHAQVKISHIDEEEKKVYGEKLDAPDTELPKMKNEKWERIIAHINSANASDWRLAVIEADIMLDELLKAQGYHGDTLGERLKAVEKSDMLTLDNAWEAHRVRNQIAHQGADFPLSEREAKRAIALYESVFREAEII